MKNLIETFTSFPRIAWVILAGTFCTSASFFMSLPFLALYLTKSMGLSPVLAGSIVSIAPLAGILCSFFIGFLGDKWGRALLIPIAAYGFTVAFGGFVFSKAVWQFFVFNAIYGMCRSAYRLNLTALLTDISTEQNKKLILQSQYYMINLGACVGPLAGAYFFMKGHEIAFGITALIYFFFGSFFLYYFKKHNVVETQKKAKGVGLKQVLGVVTKDKGLFFFITTFVLSSFAFVQFDTNFPQYLYALFEEDGVQYFAKIMATNAITIILLQFLILEWLSKIPIQKVMLWGLFPQTVGLALFAILPPSLYAFMFAMFIFTIGEILIIANIYVLVDKMSPSHLKSSYFGAMELFNIGYIVGPIAGGWVLKSLGGQAVFIVGSCMIFISIFTFLAGIKDFERKHELQHSTSH